MPILQIADQRAATLRTYLSAERTIGAAHDAMWERLVHKHSHSWEHRNHELLHISDD